MFSLIHSELLAAATSAGSGHLWLLTHVLTETKRPPPRHSPIEHEAEARAGSALGPVALLERLMVGAVRDNYTVAWCLFSTTFHFV